MSDTSEAAGKPGARDSGRSGATRWPLRRVANITVLIMVVFALAAVGGGGAALANLLAARDRVVNVIDPAVFQTQQLDAALLNQETGVRGYALGAQDDFLVPYTRGVSSQRQAVARLRQLTKDLPAPAAADLARVVAQATTWRTRYAQPVINQVRHSGMRLTRADVGKGKAEFNLVRARVAPLQGDLYRDRRQAVAALNDASLVLISVCAAIAAGLIILVVSLALVLRGAVIGPLNRLAAEARRVAGGDFGHEVSQGGPQEVTDLAADVNTMRVRILQELGAVQSAQASLEARAHDLQRSNAELEQFAYVASHDLQEPLRKVTSFCQLLQRRYGGQLDERADQYIDFAVDGARRMQTLINDLLAFSRVGRGGQQPAPVSCDAALAEAAKNLDATLRQAGATVRHGELPVVLAQPALLTAVFQNLLSNAVKFRADRPPLIVVDARREGACWVLSVTDNGIGVSPEYADRIFVIFQRLHDRATYPGTGIGLALCRKIIDYFGGTIWLDTTVRDGARFCFTLPVLPENGVISSPEPEEANVGPR